MSQHELTSRIAYEIYLQRGQRDGRHQEDWIAAELIVSLCLSFACARAMEEEPEADPEDLRARALAKLEEAVAGSSRAAVAKALGYKSASSVGRYLRGDRPLGDALVERILATFAPPAVEIVPAPLAQKRAA